MRCIVHHSDDYSMGDKQSYWPIYCLVDVILTLTSNRSAMLILLNCRFRIKRLVKFDLAFMWFCYHDVKGAYLQTYKISHTLVGNRILDHSDVVGA